MSLRCVDVGVSADGRKVLAQVNLDIFPGRFTAILGPNGAGKSTLLSVLTGQRQPLGGQVLLDGKALGQTRAATLAQRRAVMLQESAVAFDFLAREVVELGRFPHRRNPTPQEDAIVAQAMQATHVGHLAQRNVNTLSGGEKARVQLARSLAQIWEPRPDGADRWLFLDEPTAALDLAHQHQMMRLMRQWAHTQSTGVVAVLHDVNLALRYADDVLVLGVGACHSGAACDVLTPGLIDTIWGVQCQPVRGEDGVAQYLFA